MEQSRASGGVALYLHSSLDFSQIPLNTPLEAVAARITLHIPITICNIYLPSSQQITLSTLSDLISQLPTPLLLLGDFNAHNTMWGSLSTSPRGEIVSDLISSQNLMILNHQTPTFLSSSSGSFSSIDLSISSPSLSTILEWDIAPEPYSSDHFPIIIRFLLSAQAPPDRQTKWILTRANWEHFATLASPPPLPINDVNEYLHDFTNSILTAANKAIPFSNPKFNKPPVPWWTSSCSKAIQNRKKALNTFKRHPTTDNFIAFKRMRSIARKITRQAKIESWNRFVANIKSPISSNSLWTAVRRMKGSSSNKIPILRTNNTHITDQKEIPNVLASHFSQKAQSSNPMSFPPLDISNFDTDQLIHYNSPFSLPELHDALRKTRCTAPGPDNIHVEMINQLSKNMLDCLLTIYNHIWINSKYPSTWLHSITIPIFKPGKPRSIPNSYRPISLTNHLGKILERMVLHRLSWIIETKHLLSPFQYGFRRYRSSMDHLASLETDIRRTFFHKNHLLLTSLDLTSAFDMTDRTTILTQLHTIGLRGALPKFIYNFLQPRSFRVKANGIFSKTYTLSLGVPQGAVLSPTLFNLALKPLTECIFPPTKYKIFADDIILYTSSSLSSVCTDTLQRSLNSINAWAIDNGFTFSPQKSTTIHFCKRRNCPRINNLHIANNILPSSDHLNILGLTFDHRLTWKNHIQTLKTRTSTDINLLRMLSGVTWGADFPSLLHIYKSLILSKLNYGNFVYDSASPHLKKSLDPIQNHSLRLATGAFRTSPIPSIQCISAVPPLQFSRQLSLLKYYSSTLFRSHTRISLNLANIHKYNQILPPESIPNRIFNLVSLHNISPPKYDYPLQTSFPPWLSPRPSVDLHLHSYNKSDYPNAFLNKQFLERISRNYPNHCLFYTDGSKTDKGVGAAFISQNIIKMYKLPIHATIFSAELLAIKEAIRYSLSSTSNTRSLIISDSLSALTAIKSRNLDYNYIRHITDLMYIAKLKHRSISFLWLPSHIGNSGNDKADTYAKLAIERGSIYIGENHFSDFNIFLGSIHKSLFQLQWDLEDPNNKLWSIKSSTFPPLNSPTMGRKDNVLLRRLAVGHTFSTHVYLIKNEPPPLCSICGLSLSVIHVFESEHHKSIRDKHHIPSNLKLALESFETHKDNIKKFLKEIDFQV